MRTWSLIVLSAFPVAALLGPLVLVGVARPASLKQFQVNTYAQAGQQHPSLSFSESGDLVIVWDSAGSAGSDTNFPSIQGQRYDPAGNEVGAEFQINTYTTGTQRNPAVSVDSDGDFVVVWESLGSAGSDTSLYSVQGQRYDSVGNAIGTQFQVNTHTASWQTRASVSMDFDGDFVVVWQSAGGGAGSDTSSYSVQGQRYDSAGSAVGTEFQVNTYTTNAQRHPSVSMDWDGDFVVVWHSSGSAGSDTSLQSIQGQRYDASGSPLGGEFQINTYTTSTQYRPSVSIDADGDFVVVWESSGSVGGDTSSDSIQGQRYDSAGSAIGVQFQVNTYTTGKQKLPRVSMDSNGDFVVVWESDGSAGSDISDESIQGQRYNSAGSAVGVQFQVNTYTTNEQENPSISIISSGGLLAAVWASAGSAGSDNQSFSIQALGRQPRLIPSLGSVALVFLAASLMTLGATWRRHTVARQRLRK